MKNFFDKFNAVLVILFKILLAIILIFCECSCNKYEECNDLKENKLSGQSTLFLSLKGSNLNNEIISKVSEIEGGYEDTNVDTLDIFVFKNSDRYPTDTYKHLTSEDIPYLTDIPIRTTVGKKIICVIANSHISDSELKDIKDYNSFKSLVTDLKNENVNNWSMYGEKECELEANTEVSISLTRFVAKISLSQLNINFENTPYQNSDCTVKAYLTNVIGQKIIWDGDNTDKVLIYNKEKNDNSTINFHNESIIKEDLMLINNKLKETHYFFCYENTIEKENSNLEYTRLVIELSLDGHTYYYPININQINYGYQQEYDHHGIQRNTEYDIKLTIEHPGSSDPNVPITTNDYHFDIIVTPWYIHPVSTIKF